MKAFVVNALAAAFFLGRAIAQEDRVAETEMAPLCAQTAIHGELGYYYPTSGVGQRPVAGGATIDCAFDGQGRVSSCVVLSENPAGRGFGESALRLACVFAISNHSGRSVLSAHNLIPTGSVPIYEYEGKTRARVSVNFPPIRNSACGVSGHC